MKFFKDNWAILLILVSAIFFFWEWQCNHPALPANDKKQNDSLTRVINGVQWAHDRKIDSLTKVNQDLQEFAESAGKTVFSLSDSITFIKQTVRGLQAKLRDRPDTIGLIDPACADLSEHFDKYILMTDAKEKLQDSIIIAKDHQLANVDSSLADRAGINSQLRQSFSMVSDNYNHLYASYSGQSKKLQWFKVKEKGLMAVVLLTGGKILFDSFKK